MRYCCSQPLHQLCGTVLPETGYNDDKFIATHARRIVVFAATFLYYGGKYLQQFVAFEVAELVVDLFESVKVRHKYAQREFRTLTAGNLVFQVQEERPRVGQTSEVV